MYSNIKEGTFSCGEQEKAISDVREERGGKKEKTQKVEILQRKSG